MKKENKILDISKAFAIRIIRLYQYLRNEKQEYILSKQLLKSGTSIGANVRESINAQSLEDFIHKLNISLKESNETEYWIELLYETDYINEQQFSSIISDNKEITATLIKIIKTSKAKNNAKKE
ncbi:MAG: four helix bundle protein [Prevotella sp.]|nr:four helix bundle protein [Prevotella sp.]